MALVRSHLERLYRDSSDPGGVLSRGAGWHPVLPGSIPALGQRTEPLNLLFPEAAEGDLVRRVDAQGKVLSFYVVYRGLVRRLAWVTKGHADEKSLSWWLIPPKSGEADLEAAWRGLQDPGMLVSYLTAQACGAREALLATTDVFLEVLRLSSAQHPVILQAIRRCRLSLLQKERESLRVFAQTFYERAATSRASARSAAHDLIQAVLRLSPASRGERTRGVESHRCLSEATKLVPTEEGRDLELKKSLCHLLRQRLTVSLLCLATARRASRQPTVLGG